MATHFSILVWRIQWIEEPGRLQSVGLQRDTTERLTRASESRSLVSESLRPHGLYSPWNSPGQNTGVGSLSFLQQIFLTQESNGGLLHCRRILYQLSYRGRLTHTHRFNRGKSKNRIESFKLLAWKSLYPTLLLLLSAT